MCAILDANIVHEVFRPSGSEAGKKFFQWLNSGKGLLVAGGKAYEELKISLSYDGREWIRQAQLSGKMKVLDKNMIEEKTDEIAARHEHRSNDPHILALAQVSGARLLYTNDMDLQQDFKDGTLINSPRGKVYTTRKSKKFEDSHKNLLANKNLCRLD